MKVTHQAHTAKTFSPRAQLPRKKNYFMLNWTIWLLWPSFAMTVYGRKSYWAGGRHVILQFKMWSQHQNHQRSWWTFAHETRPVVFEFNPAVGLCIDINTLYIFHIYNKWWPFYKCHWYLSNSLQDVQLNNNIAKVLFFKFNQHELKGHCIQSLIKWLLLLMWHVTYYSL